MFDPLPNYDEYAQAMYAASVSSEELLSSMAEFAQEFNEAIEKYGFNFTCDPDDSVDKPTIVVDSGPRYCSAASILQTLKYGHIFA